MIDRCLDFFLMLPKTYRTLLRSGEIDKSRASIASDLLRLFFDYKTFPDHYGPCRLWEMDESQWKYYYGSSYQAYQRRNLHREVEPPEYVVVFADKTISERLCRDIGVNVPHSYGTVSPNENYRDKIESWVLSSAEDAFLLKPVRSGGGRGIDLVRKDGGRILVNTRSGVVPLGELVVTQQMILQAFIKQDARLAAFSASSVNTVRVAALFTKSNSVVLLGAAFRCGRGGAYIDNWSAGGVAVGVDLDTGRLKKYAYDKEGNRYVEHPTSKIVFEGWAVPQWRCIRETVIRIQKAFPCYRMLGIDVALQENGEPLVIEVNDNLDVTFVEQTSGPLLRNEAVLRAFGEYELFVNRHQRKLFQQMVVGR
jgi:hypothetical protein